LHIPEWIPQDNYNPAETSTVSVSKTLIPLETPYISTLPRLPAAPSNGNKRRKKNSKDDNKDLHHLQVEYQLNPLSGSLAKSTKCVLTADWRVAQSELRHIRAMERIQEKEKNGRWSLRQPKKLRHPPIPKSHWDYLLEEAEWMRTDFAEERRWKIVEAREFAYQCVEWHLAKPDEKASLMVGGRGWGACNGVPIPGRTAGPMSAEDDVEMLVQVDGEDSPAAAQATNLDATGAQVLDEIMPEKGQEGDAVKKEAENDDADAEGEDAEGEVDAEADAEGEADADGEEDAEGEDAEGDAAEDVGEGVIGLDCES
jgi:chromatin modification-related protein VID21